MEKANSYNFVHEGSWPVTSVVKAVSPEGEEPRELFRSPWPGFIPGNQGLEWTQEQHDEWKNENKCKGVMKKRQEEYQ